MMCSGRVDILHVFEGFQAGADGVLVGGCKLGECKYSEGNLQALVMAEVVRTLMQLIKLDLRRFKLSWLSAAEPNKLVDTIKSFTDELRELGPIGEAEGISKEELNFYLENVVKVCKDKQVRAIYGNIAKELKKTKDFNEETIAKKVEQKLGKLLKDKLYEYEIRELVKEGPKSVDVLQEKTGASIEDIEKILNKLKKA